MSEVETQIALARQIGQVEGRLAALEEKTQLLEQRIERRLAAIEGKLDQLTTALNFGRGGWKALAVAGTVVAGIAALGGWVIDHFLLTGAGP